MIAYPDPAILAKALAPVLRQLVRQEVERALAERERKQQQEEHPK